MGLLNQAEVVDKGSAEVNNKGHRKYSTDPEVAAWEVEIAKRKQLKVEQSILEPMIKQLYAAIENNSKEQAVAVFIEYAVTKGFKQEAWFDKIERGFELMDLKTIIGFTKFLTNQYLKSIEGCYKQQRGVKIKQPKYQFETKPKSVKEVDREFEVRCQINNFLNNMLEDLI